MLCKITITGDLCEKLNEVSDSMGLELDPERTIRELIEYWERGNQ